MKLENKDILNQIYENKAEELDKIIKEKNKETEEEIGNKKIEEIYNIKTAKIAKEFYKQGFIDGVNLILNCLK